MIYIGIDVGAKGGFALVCSDSHTAEVNLWDDNKFSQRMREIKMSGEHCMACVEKVNAMPGNGAVSMFRFGQSLGYIIGVLTALEIPFQLVPPRVWKKEFSLDNDKQKSIATCERLFPSVNLVPPRCKKPSDGCAESLLLACYASRHFNGG